MISANCHCNSGEKGDPIEKLSPKDIEMQKVCAMVC